MSDRKALLDRLLDPFQVLVFDGAMGTQLYAKGVFINQCYDELNLRAPDLIRDVHRAYIKAGAEVKVPHIPSPETRVSAQANTPATTRHAKAPTSSRSNAQVRGRFISRRSQAGKKIRCLSQISTK